MIVKEYIREFEKLGLGMFVHFGIYSLLGKGEWVKHQYRISHEEYYPLHEDFCPSPDWAEKLVLAAKSAGCRYITLTARHHDGFSLYDTCGLNKLATITESSPSSIIPCWTGWSPPTGRIFPHILPICGKA